MTTEVFDHVPLAAELAVAVRTNKLYRHVLYTSPPEETGQRMQIVAMALGMLPPEIDSATDLGFEVHEDTTQSFAVLSGAGVKTTSNGTDPKDVTTESIAEHLDSNWTVAAHQWHNVSIQPGGHLQLLTVYYPPHHPPGTIDVSKAAAEERMARG